MSEISNQIVSSVKKGNLITVCSVGIDEYEKVTMDSVNSLLKNEMGGVYVTASRPASILIKEIDVDHGEFYFVDMISENLGGSTSDPRTSYIESPTMLESVLLNLNLVMRRLRTKKNFIILDSINSLAVHSGNRILEEFIHVLSNTMKLKEVSSVLFTVKEQTSVELTNVLKLLADRFVGEEV